MNLKRGINLGGFLSQCEHDMEHYQTFIKKEDIKQICDWGFDHVRLPVDYEVLEDENGVEIPDGYAIVKNIVTWCEEYGLNIIIDLHKAYGYDFNDAGNSSKNSLFTDDKMQMRFLNLWSQIANAFKSYDCVAFELLNEVVETENAVSWNRLIKRAVEVIRNAAPTAPVIYGGIMWNSAKTLKLLEIPRDKNIIFTFHFYEPLVFTHQKAYWVKNMDRELDISYPGTKQYYDELSSKIGDQGKGVLEAKSEYVDINYIREMMQEAVDAATNAGVSLYCGEYGVIDQAPLEDTLRWFKDVDTVFREFDIGCAVWNYKDKDFGIADKHYDDIRGELLSIVNACKKEI